MTERNLLVLKNFTSQPPKTKLALFDLDDTLIKYLPNSSSVVMKSLKIKAKLVDLHASNFFIAVLSNQMDILSTEEQINRFTEKIERLMRNLDVPILFVAALKRDFYRKPAPGMLDVVKQYVNAPDLNKSFYCGDAAGRQRDHSDCDLKLAFNMNIRFVTPEMCFNGVKKDFVPNFIKIRENKANFDVPEVDENSQVFVYGKGRHSGKTFFVSKFFKGAENVVINCQDLDFIKKAKGKICIYLDYDENALRWLRVFCELTGKKSKGGSRKDEFDKVKGCFKKIIRVKFNFDEEGFSEYERKVSQLAL